MPALTLELGFADDGDPTCRATVCSGSINGTVQFRYFPHEELRDFAQLLKSCPLPHDVAEQWNGGSLKLGVERVGTVGQLRFLAFIQDEYDEFNFVQIRVPTSYEALRQFAHDLTDSIGIGGTAKL